MHENPYEAPSIGDSGTVEEKVTRDDEGLRLPFLPQEAQIRVLAIFYLSLAFILAASLVVLLFSKQPRAGLQFLEIPARTILILIAAVSGYGLWCYHGWARASAFILSIPGLFIFPAGTLFSALLLIILSDPKKSPIFTPSYRLTVSMTSHLKPRSSLRFKLIFCGTLLLCILMVAGALFKGGG